MSITIENPETERLARELARRRGVGVAEAVNAALEAELARAPAAAAKEDPGLAERLLKIAEEYRKLPVLDDRTPEEILDYDEHGLPR
ncbi:MAG: type II toxin-antitoxin system VapB family antitoxin [Hyphomonadaceae bacterium]|jgi:antitoxin VapB|nr:type II toxin-antitoxin system VapB family antitoxin [Hyphomonadaceae bacterium]